MKGFLLGEMGKEFTCSLSGAKEEILSLWTACMLSHSVVSDSAISWTVTCQAPLSMGFSSQEYWSELPFPPPEDLPNPGMESVSLGLSSRFFTTASPGKCWTAW